MARPSAGVVILQMKAEVPAGGFAAAAKALAARDEASARAVTAAETAAQTVAKTRAEKDAAA